MQTAEQKFTYTSVSVLLNQGCPVEEILEAIRSILGEVAERLDVPDNLMQASEVIHNEDGTRLRFAVRGSTQLIVFTLSALIEQYPECLDSASLADVVTHDSPSIFPSDVWPDEGLKEALREEGFELYVYMTPLPTYLPHSLASSIIIDSIKSALTAAGIDDSSAVRGWESFDGAQIAGVIEVGCWCSPECIKVLDDSLDAQVHSRLSGVILNEDITRRFSEIIGDRGYES